MRNFTKFSIYKFKSISVFFFNIFCGNFVGENSCFVNSCLHISVFTDAGIEYIGEQIVPYMSDWDFYAAFNEFADQCDLFMAQARTGEAYDSHNLPKDPFAPGASLVIALVIGFIIALIYTGSLKGQLKSVQAQRAAAGYVKNGSLQITNSRDLFLYRHVTKTEKQTESSSGGGGSSTHRSSSGTTHGGGGGKF